MGLLRGVDTPKTIAASLPFRFQDPTGTYFRFDFDGGLAADRFYARVQETVDALKVTCDAVVVVGHLGTEADCKPFRSEDLIARTTNGVYRVRNVRVYDRDSSSWQPLELEREYLVAGLSSLLRESCDGACMWTNGMAVANDLGLDFETFAAYCRSFEAGSGGLPELASANSPLHALSGYPLDYATPYGESRIVRFAAYPSYLAEYGDAVKEKFDVWATTFGSRDPDGIYTNAFLLNVATNREAEAEAAFAIGSIAITNEVVGMVTNTVVVLERARPLPPSTTFNGVTWLQCATNGLSDAAWLDIETGRYTEGENSFFIERIDFEHVVTPGAFPTEAEGVKTIRVRVK